MKRKWYVIKDNNTNKYYDGGSGDDCWVYDINLAHFFYDKSDAKHEKDVGWSKYKFNDDCEIIELCEDDEEYQELKEYNDELKQQLVEKDKEIEQIKDNQNHKAIECLKEALEHFGDRPAYLDVATLEYHICDQDKRFIDYINNKIKELEEEE